MQKSVSGAKLIIYIVADREEGSERKPEQEREDKLALARGDCIVLYRMIKHLISRKICKCAFAL